LKEYRINEYWCSFFGITNDEMNSMGISIVPHKFLRGYNGAWIFRRRNRIIISVRPKDLSHINNKVKLNRPDENIIFSQHYIAYLFGYHIERIIGPTFQGYYDSDIIHYESPKNVRLITYRENEQEINRISNTGDMNGWNNSGMDECESIYGFFSDSNLLSIANYKMVQGDAGFIGVYTDPKYRGKGYGQQVVRKVVEDLSKKGKLVLYQTLLSNIPSKKIADRVGIIEFGRNIAIRLK
jgi:RimJ/RimL family protein N-acetyltransferase